MLRVRREQDREILRLAFPAFLTLLAEPLFLLADSAIIGHLGTGPLAGLSIAGTVMSLTVGLCIFLAYGTTGSVARQVGAGDRRAALAQGVSGLWLAVALGIVLTLAGVLLAHPLTALFGASPEVQSYAVDYLRVAVLGLTPLLLMLAATGVLRGLQDTRTPLVVAVSANVINVVLNYVLVYGLDWGIAGSAWGTVIAQSLAALALVRVVLRGARLEHAPFAPMIGGIRDAARAAVPLVIRSLSLQAALAGTTYAASVLAGAGDQAVHLATHQLTLTIWFFLAYALDAIAIAAQAITGRYLGAGDVAATQAVTGRMVQWGVWSGAAAALPVVAISPWAGLAFTNDPEVQRLLTRTLLVVALGLPLAGVVFVLDGILIGAGDTRFLAGAQVLALLAYAPLATAVVWTSDSLPLLWAAFAIGWVAVRCALLVIRQRGGAWLVTGAQTPR
ncbi:MAG: MATE family efflux transporter [Nocardioides sp.]